MRCLGRSPSSFGTRKRKPQPPHSAHLRPANSPRPNGGVIKGRSDYAGRCKSSRAGSIPALASTLLRDLKVEAEPDQAFVELGALRKVRRGIHVPRHERGPGALHEMGE